MGEMYDRIENLCKRKGINVSQLCRETGVNRGNLSDLKMGRQQSLSAKNANKIAEYFGVSVDFLLTGEQKEKPTANGERMTDKELKFALWGDSDVVDDDDLEDVRRYAAYVAERKKAKK